MTVAEFINGFPTLWGLIHPRAIDRFRPALIGMEMALFAIGLLFWLDTQTGGDNFSPETYGAWACSLPAEMWAGVMLAGGVLCVSGLMHPVTRWRIVVGALVHVVQFTALSFSAILTGGQFVIAIFPLLFFVPLHIILAWEAVIYDPCGSP